MECPTYFGGANPFFVVALYLIFFASVVFMLWRSLKLVQKQATGLRVASDLIKHMIPLTDENKAVELDKGMNEFYAQMKGIGLIDGDVDVESR